MLAGPAGASLRQQLGARFGLTEMTGSALYTSIDGERWARLRLR